MDKEEFDRVVEAVEEAGYEVRSYSGRGMYGKECLGVECDDPVKFMLELAIGLAETCEDAGEVADFLEMLRDPQTDSMGLGSIIYWPRITWQGE
jgi:hypothetical protein